MFPGHKAIIEKLFFETKIKICWLPVQIIQFQASPPCFVITPGLLKFHNCGSEAFYFPQPLSSYLLAPLLSFQRKSSKHSYVISLRFSTLQKLLLSFCSVQLLKEESIRLCSYSRVSIWTWILPLFSLLESYLVCLFLSLFLSHSIYESSRVFKIQLSPLVIPFVFPVTTMLFKKHPHLFPLVPFEKSTNKIPAAGFCSHKHIQTRKFQIPGKQEAPRTQQRWH